MDVMSPSVLPEWDRLPDHLQLLLARQAMRRAAESIAGQAETLAGEIEAGSLADHGGAEALRLLAAVVRLAAEDHPVSCGTA